VVVTDVLLGCGDAHQEHVGPLRVALKLQPFRLALAWETSVELRGCPAPRGSFSVLLW